jgi:hypothetical protein
VPLDKTKKTWQGRGRFGRCITRLLFAVGTMPTLVFFSAADLFLPHYFFSAWMR